MENKFDIFDLLTALIPGSVVLFSFSILYNGLIQKFSLKDPALELLVFVILSFVVGHAMIAIKSTRIWKDLMEGSLRHPSGYVFKKGLGDSVMSPRLAMHIRARILKKERLDGASDEEVFVLAMKYAEAGSSSKLTKIYALYEFYRVMMVAVIWNLVQLFFALFVGSFFIEKPLEDRVIFFMFGFLFHAVLYSLFRVMAKSRAIYWVREVLLSASRATG